MEAGASKFGCWLPALCLAILPMASQDLPNSPPDITIPDKFTRDMEFAVRQRPQLMAESVAPGARYRTACLVFERLVAQLNGPSKPKLTWELRIVDDNGLNAYSSPDGSIYVESGLARLAGASPGLWAAILSHEISHVIRRDWARRYLYEKYLENGQGGQIVLGDPTLPNPGWFDSEKASEDLGQFCRRMELEADRDGLMLMAKAGFHPDFVPSLHHLLHAQNGGAQSSSLYAMHPCWEERDRQLSQAYVEASIEFAHRWPEWYSSPGGNPPVLVFTDEPTVRKSGAEWRVQIPIRCQNLAGAVEVVLQDRSPARPPTSVERLAEPAAMDSELHQLTGCTSPRTTITFTLSNFKPERWTDVYVLDAWGAVLARAQLPKLPR